MHSKRHYRLCCVFTDRPHHPLAAIHHLFSVVTAPRRPPLTRDALHLHLLLRSAAVLTRRLLPLHAHDVALPCLPQGVREAHRADTPQRRLLRRGEGSLPLTAEPSAGCHVHPSHVTHRGEQSGFFFKLNL